MVIFHSYVKSPESSASIHFGGPYGGLKKHMYSLHSSAFFSGYLSPFGRTVHVTDALGSSWGGVGQ